MRSPPKSAAENVMAAARYRGDDRGMRLAGMRARYLAAGMDDLPYQAGEAAAAGRDAGLDGRSANPWANESPRRLARQKPTPAITRLTLGKISISR